MNQSLFKPLTSELGKWSAKGLIPQFWWRDDDGQKITPQLEQLFFIHKQYQTPLTLATIPAGIDIQFARYVSHFSQIKVVQHGFRHNNYAPAWQRKMELGCHRPLPDIWRQLDTGRRSLETLFGKQFITVLVPPWNRIDDHVLTGLRAIDFIGLSTIGSCLAKQTVQGLQQINVHIDIIKWGPKPCFVGSAHCIQEICSHLRARRKRSINIFEPIGIMSHHLFHDQACWEFLAQLIAYLSTRAEASVISAHELFDITH